MKTPLWLPIVLLALPAFAGDPGVNPCEGKGPDFDWKADGAYKAAFAAIETNYKSLPDDGDAAADHKVLDKHAVSSKLSSSGRTVWMVGGGDEAASVTPVQGQDIMKDVCLQRHAREQAASNRDAEMTEAARKVAAADAQHNQTAETLKLANSVLADACKFSSTGCGAPPAATPEVHAAVVSVSLTNGNSNCNPGDCDCLCPFMQGACHNSSSGQNALGTIACRNAINNASSCIVGNSRPDCTPPQ